MRTTQAHSPKKEGKISLVTGRSCTLEMKFADHLKRPTPSLFRKAF